MTSTTKPFFGPSMRSRQEKNLSLVIILVLFVCSGCSVRSTFVREQLSPEPAVRPSDEQIIQTLFFIGDAGEPAHDYLEPNFAALEYEAGQHPDKNTVIFLGDNIYPDGIPEESDPQHAIAEQRLKEQCELIKRSNVSGIFIAGNHDWGKGSEDGVGNLKREEQALEKFGDSKIQMSPSGVTPGPAYFDIGTSVRVITLNTEWWLRDQAKYIYPSTRSKSDTKTAVTDSIVQLIKSSKERSVIVIGHHPLTSHGEHGGFFDWTDHIFPLHNLASWLWLPTPIIGSLYPFLRNRGLSSEDESSGVYKEFTKDLTSAFSLAPPLVYASGHEHTLEVINGPGKFTQLISGFGTAQHDPSLTHGDNTLFASRHTGFMRIDILEDKRARLCVIEPNNDSRIGKEVFSMWLVGENHQ